MGQQEWRLVNSFLVTEGTGASINNVYHYVFKKEFSKEEVDKSEE